MTTRDPLYLMGPDFVAGLPLFPPGEPADFLIDLTQDLRYAIEHDASLLMPPTPAEWVELAVRSGRPLLDDEIADARSLAHMSDETPLSFRAATLAHQCRNWCEQHLPNDVRIVIANDGAVLRGGSASGWTWDLATDAVS